MVLQEKVTSLIYGKIIIAFLVVACQRYLCPNVISMTMNVFIFRNLSFKTVFIEPYVKINYSLSLSLSLSLLNSSEDDPSKDFVYDSFKNISFNQGMHVTVNEVLSLVHSLKSGKSAGLDGLNGECLKYADVILSVLLSFCFTCMFKHSYLPSALLDSVIIPLVKNKCGDLSDISNYRPIAISCIVSKIFENVILLRIEEYLWTTDNQFGFKAHHSTDLCVHALTEFIEHFKNRSTSVYVAFLDASKAFDKINHWLLFKKLIERQVPLYLVTILCYWYRHQEMFVRWGSSLSIGFRVTNAVCQGCILSPLLFNVYINDLSIRLSETGIGGSISGKFVNHMIYADDLCVISLSSSGLQSLLNICTEYCQLHDLTFNAKKSVCMFQLTNSVVCQTSSLVALYVNLQMK